MKVYPINYDCSKEVITNTREEDVKNTVPLAKEWVKKNITKGIDKDDLVRLIEKNFPVLITSEVISLVIDPIIGVDLKYYNVKPIETDITKEVIEK